MGFRKKLIALLSDSPRGDTQEIEPTAPPSPQSQLEPKSSGSTPQNLQRRRSEAGGATSEIQSGPSCVPNVDEAQNKPAKLSSYVVDPTAAYENKTNWKSTLYASTGVAIEVLKESSDVCTPLKSVVGGLSAILKHSDQAMANRKTIESMIPRVEGLAESLSAPAPENEINEIERRQTLRRKLEKTLQDLEPLAERGRITGFLNNVKDAEVLAGLSEDIRDAMTDYQTALQQDIYNKNHQLVDAADRSLLNSMDHTANAGYLSGDRNGCLKGTRKEVLLQIEQWLRDEKDQRIFWLNGFAGTGKSTIAQTFAEISFADGKLGASFFCSRNFDERSSLQSIFPTLAFQLAYRYPQFRIQLLQILKANPHIGQETLCSQLEKVIIRPLKSTQIPTLIIIDALDECKDKEPASALLSVLSRYVHEIPHAKFFITGRPEPPIQEGFRLELLRPITDVLKLHDVKRSLVDEDIKLYLRTHLTNISKTRRSCKFPEEWPYSYDIDLLCKKAAGLFIYASTVVKFVASKHHLPTKRLDLIILGSKGAAHEGGIDLLYTQILQLAFEDVGSTEHEVFSHFRIIVGAVLLLFHPLSRKDLSDLVRHCGTPSDIFTALDSLHSLLNIPDSEDDPICVFHKSFPDFLTEPTRCRDERFFVDPSVHHEIILFSCLDLMKERLRKNICGLDDYVVLSEVQDLSARKKTYIGGPLEYACRFWTKHLASIPCNGLHVTRMQEAIDEFFAKRLLFWIEVLSIIGHLGVAVHAINEIRQWYISAGTPTSEHADDSERLILEYFEVIRDSPSHIYHSALPLSPSSTWLRKCYKQELSQEVSVVAGLPARWSTCSRTIFIEDDPSAFAHRKDIIAVGLGCSVELLDAITGSRKTVLSDHSKKISSLAFSQDGTLLVSGGYDKTVKVWDMQTGGVIKTFNDEGLISAVSISPDCTTIASATDGTIRLWDVRAGKCRPDPLCHDRGVTTINFSPVNSQRLISSSSDGAVRQWDVDGHQIGVSYQESDRVNGLAYTSDGTHFVSRGRNFVSVRDSESGAVVVKLEAPDKGSIFTACCLSPDGRFMACAVRNIIRLWDITNSEARLVRTLTGHTMDIHYLSFSSSLVSVSMDQSLKFWQSSSFLTDSETTGDTSTQLGSAPIRSLRLFAEEDNVVTTDQSGMVKTWDLTMSTCRSSILTPVPTQALWDVHLAGDSLTVVWSDNCGTHSSYRVWGGGRDQVPREVPCSIPYHGDLRISADGSKICGANYKHIEVRSIETGEEVGFVEHGSGDVEVDDLVVSGSKVWVAGSKDVGWDFGGQGVSTFSPSTEFPNRSRFDFIKSKGYREKQAWILDTVTGRPIFHIPERFIKHKLNQGREWDGRYLVIWHDSGEVLIVDFDRVCPR